MTDVIRSSTQGDAHGGAYLIDLEVGGHERVLDWNRIDIDWEGRGAGRGLRGISVVGDELYIAASDELFVFDRSFEIVRSHTNPYLHHCHEISYDGERWLHLTSTTYNAVLRFDTAARRFDRAWFLGTRGGSALETVAFDPGSDSGPPRGDVLHLNQAFARDGGVFVSGTRMGGLYRLADDRAEPWARVPVGTHNCRPMRGGLVIMNDTESDAVLLADRRGRRVRTMQYPVYDERELVHAGIDADYARQGFGRGLVVDEDRGIVVAGSSPGTVSAFDLSSGERLRSVNVSMDIRNAPHGLAIWPPDAT